jgi:hypothetical protein
MAFGSGLYMIIRFGFIYNIMYKPEPKVIFYDSSNTVLVSFVVSAALIIYR